MRLVFGVLAGCTALVPLLSAQAETDRQRDELRGPVRLVRTTAIIAEMRHSKGAVSYDQSGNYTRREIVSDFGEAIGTETFSYRNGRLIDVRLSDAKGVLLQRREYTYRPAGDRETLTITADGDSYTERYTQDPSGRLREITYRHRGADVGQTVFTYQNDTQPSQVAFFRPAGVPATATIGPCLGAHRLVYQYAAGRVSQLEIYQDNGTLQRRSVFTYDARGNVVDEERPHSRDILRLHYEYQYDRHDNWIRRTETVTYAGLQPKEAPSLATRVTLREITYY